MKNQKTLSYMFLFHCLFHSQSPFQDEPSDAQFSKQGFSQTAQVLQMENDVDLNLIKERETAIHQLEVKCVQLFKLANGI